MSLYETVFIARPDLSEEEVAGIIQRVKDLVQNEGGDVTDVERWGKRKLAYRVGKERHGHYVMLHYHGNPQTSHEIERFYRISEQVLKYMTIRIWKGQPVRIEMEREEIEVEHRATGPEPRSRAQQAAAPAAKRAEAAEERAKEPAKAGEPPEEMGLSDESDPGRVPNSHSATKGEGAAPQPVLAEKREEAE